MKYSIFLCLFLFNTLLIKHSVFSITPIINTELKLRDCRKISDAQERNGCETIVLTKMASKQIEGTIGNLEEKSSRSKAIIDKINGIKQQEKTIKSKYKIDQLENQMNGLEVKKSLLESSTFGSAAEEYSQIGDLINNILTDAIVKDKLDKILALKKEISERVQQKIEKIQDLGKKITQKITPKRDAINSFMRDELIPLQQKINTVLLTKDVDKELNEIYTQEASLRTDLRKSLSEVLTTQEREQIETLQNSKTRKEILLKLLENPNKIADIQLDHILGLESIN